MNRSFANLVWLLMAMPLLADPMPANYANQGHFQVSPAQGDIVRNGQPAVHVIVEAELEPLSTRLFLDNTEVSQEMTIEGKSIHYEPEGELSAGSHHLLLQAYDTQGQALSKEWDFRIYNEDNDQNPSIDPSLSVSNLPEGSLVDGLFWLEGNTRPYARLDLTVLEHRDSPLKGVLGDWEQVSSATSQANGTGAYKLQVDVRKVHSRTPLRLQLSALDRAGALSPLTQIQVNRR